MIVGLVIGCSLLAPMRVQGPVGPPPAQQQKQPFKPPTPWFDKDEDTFSLPTNPKHLADLKRDADEGRKAAEEVLQEIPASTNMAYQERVERIGQTIAHIANHMDAIASWGDKRHNVYHYHYTVLKGDEVNAFSLPGGYVFVYEGLMQFVESDDELAGVLAHETAHAAFRHVAVLQHDANKMLIFEIPVIIGSILARDPSVILGGQLGAQAFVSGWTIEAEKAADYGGFQFMCHSSYNPVAMLTFMERLAKHDRITDEVIRFTIDQTHPLSKQRVLAMVDDLHKAGIPIERSKASPTFRVLLADDKDGTVDASFNGIVFYRFAGEDARSRAEAAAIRLDRFFDAVPNLYEVSSNNEDLTVDWKGEKLLTVRPQDADACHMSPPDLLDKTLTLIKDSLFNLGYRIWEGPDY